MTTPFKTRNSSYEIDYEEKVIRRISGENPPTNHFSPDGDWKRYSSVVPCMGGLLVEWPDGKGTLTSAILDFDDPH